MRDAVGGAVADLVLGVRLALGGGRRGWTRLLLTALGTGIGVTVLLLAASVPSVLDAHERRQFTAEYAPAGAVRGDALHERTVADEFRGAEFTVHFVEAQGPAAPVPPGLPRLPAPGELAASPAMQRLLAGPDAGPLTRRYPNAGRALLIGPDGLTSAGERVLYVGVTGLPHDEPIVGFGRQQGEGPVLAPLLWTLLVVGVVVLLAPVAVFVGISARLSGAERDRTLAAVRLVGSSIAGTRRIAAGEALAGALLGLVLGGIGLLAARPLAERQEIIGFAPFAQDVVPAWPLALLVLAGVPVLAVATTVLALRRTLIEPLGVTRQAVTTGRRLWWRLLLPACGAVVLLALAGTGLGSMVERSELPLVAGVVLVLLGVPALLPWVLDRAVRGGWHLTPALQLATGRLRAEGGTPARVVAGLGVVLAGAIGMSSILAAAAERYDAPELDGPTLVTARGFNGARPDLGPPRAAVAAVPGVRDAVLGDRYVIEDGTGAAFDLLVLPCPALRALLDLPDCRDGEVFTVSGSGAAHLAGGSRQLTARPMTSDDFSTAPAVPVRPASMRVLPRTRAAAQLGTVIATPGAVPDRGLLPASRLLTARYDPAVPDVTDRIRAVLAPLQWRVYVLTAPATALSSDQDRFVDIRRGLFAGTLLTLGLVAATMVVAAVEQVRERRRPLAALAAAGVPRALLARSLLWQNAVPLVLAVAVADVLGALLGALVLPLVQEQARVDVTGIAVYSAAAALAAVTATLLTLPAIVRATRPAGLRAE